MSVLKLKGNDSGTGNVTLEAPNTNTDQTISIPDGAGSFVTANASGDVGIGTTSPDQLLHLSANTGATLRFESTETSVVADQVIGAIEWEGNDSSTGSSGVVGKIDYIAEDTTPEYSMRFFTHDTSGGVPDFDARMVIDSSGNLLVGKTSANSDNAGFEANSTGFTAATRDNGTVFVMDRLTSDGEIVSFRQDNTSVGSIGNVGTNLFVNSEGSGGYGRLRTQGTDRYIWSSNTFYPAQDNNLDLGTSSNRYDDVYATNGTIQTSDRNEKQQIASLTDAEITAAKAISKLFKTFKWNDKVEAKGDAARTHAGVIAQDVQQAMTDAGLDAGNYAFFISSTWWEADETYTDDDGVEQTRTNTYDTLEEAPDGATERTRLGIRYPELLAFIGAATEQRLASIEARLDALEAV